MRTHSSKSYFLAHFLCALSVITAVGARAHADLPDSYDGGPGPRVALFTNRGTWKMGASDLKKFLRSHGYSYQVIHDQDVLAGALRPEEFSVLVMPGGKSWYYNEGLGEEGARKIREYVASGGGYIGICAGAYFATELRDGPVPPKGHYDLRADGTYRYGIGLLDGIAYDGHEKGDALYGDGINAYQVLLDGRSSIYRILLLGGPSFIVSPPEAEEKHVQVVARYQGAPNGHDPTMIAFRYGNGHVFLSGPHLEIEERTHKLLSFYYGSDPDSEWPILDQAVRFARGESELDAPSLSESRPRAP